MYNCRYKKNTKSHRFRCGGSLFFNFHLKNYILNKSKSVEIILDTEGKAKELKVVAEKCI